MACKMVIVTLTKDSEYLKSQLDDFLFNNGYQAEDGWVADHGQTRAVYTKDETPLVG